MSFVEGAILTALNFVNTATGGHFDFVYKSDADQISSPEVSAARIKTLKLEGELPAGKGFDTYVNNRNQSAKKLFGLNTNDGTALSEKLSDETKATILDSLSLNTDIITNAKKAFDKDMAAIRVYVEKKSSKPIDVVHFLFETRDNAQKAMEAHHAQELKYIELKFNDEEFVKAFKLANDINDESDSIDDKKQELLKAIKQSHIDELKTFNKSINEPLELILNTPTMQKAATLDRYLENPKTAEEITKILQPSGRVIVSGEERDAACDITEEQLKTLQTIRTRNNLLLKNLDGQGTYGIDLPHRISSPLYYRSSDHKLKNDLKSIPEAIQRLGFKAIKMNLHHPNQEYAEMLAREAYAACRETGFEKDKIKLIVNGKEMPVNQLFASRMSDKQNIEIQAEKYKTDWKELQEKGARPATYFRKEVHGFHKAEEEAKTATNNTTTPIHI